MLKEDLIYILRKAPKNIEVNVNGGHFGIYLVDGDTTHINIDNDPLNTLYSEEEIKSGKVKELK